MAQNALSVLLWRLLHVRLLNCPHLDCSDQWEIQTRSLRRNRWTIPATSFSWNIRIAAIPSARAAIHCPTFPSVTPPRASTDAARSGFSHTLLSFSKPPLMAPPFFSNTGPKDCEVCAVWSLDRHLNVSRLKPEFQFCCRASCQFPDLLTSYSNSNPSHFHPAMPPSIFFTFRLRRARRTAALSAPLQWGPLQ
jgi:hypothetical protein